MSPRTVLDTNVIIAALGGNPGSVSVNRKVINLWRSGCFQVLFTEEILLEYALKLAERGIPIQRIERFIERLFDLGEQVKIAFYHLHVYPDDPDDIMFVLCAENGHASHILTYDKKHLLILNGEYSFRICPPADFLEDLFSQK